MQRRLRRTNSDDRTRCPDLAADQTFPGRGLSRLRRSVTTRFWFTHGSAPLVEGTTVDWSWGMYGVEDQIQVLAVEPDRRILISWDREAPTDVEWTFEPRGVHTLVHIEIRGFSDDEEGLAKAADSLGGFVLVLAGAKV